MLGSPRKTGNDRVCYKCRDYLKLEATRNAEAEGEGSINSDAYANPGENACPVCLGLWSDATADRLLQQLHSACEPYGGMSNNRFATKTLPTIHLPGDIALRYAVVAHSNCKIPSSFQLFSKDLKEHIRSHLHECIAQNEDMSLLRDYPNCTASEEQGHLHYHLIATPVCESRPPSFRLPKPKSNHRKRFRGNDPTEKQGGDPLVNLEKRLARAGKELWSMTEVTSVLDHCQIRDEWNEWFQQDQPPSMAVDLHVCIYRSSFFIRGLYTKSRRDVSQTPFYVPGKDSTGNNVQQRKGVTSVEEQINPTIAEISGGISKLNNDGSGSDLVYGMVKFHASGREDLDVRMTLPPEPTEGVGGRPFCLEVVDAFRLPPTEALQEAILRINHGISQVNVDGNMRYYGVNPLGVGISDCLCFAPSSTFKNLQAETEEKVKYYGCLCWSMAEIPSEAYLNDELSKCPIALDQRTPIRVVHRRSNIIRKRHVLTLKATKIDDHYFRLNISTDAGTYVKEFVHGDLGRTVPSVSSLLGCKTDILELDCEGIKF
jgi:tRNA pseudouridine(54/55) synthase